MVTVNYIVRDSISMNGLISDTNFDENMPDIYRKIHPGRGILKGFILLGMEISENGSEFVRATTRLEKDLQQVELAWKGNPLEEGLLKEINQNYRRGMKMDQPPRFGGTTRVGFFLKDYVQTLRIENFDGNGYHVRNIVELPIHLRS